MSAFLDSQSQRKDHHQIDRRAFICLFVEYCVCDVWLGEVAQGKGTQEEEKEKVQVELCCASQRRAVRDLSLLGLLLSSIAAQAAS